MMYNKEVKKRIKINLSSVKLYIFRGLSVGKGLSKVSKVFEKLTY